MHSSGVETLLVLMVASVLAVALPAPAWSWGSQTHHYIAQNYSKHLPPEIDGLRAYDSIVDQKVTDPDTRRPYTPGEGPRHFIDIDYYAEFFSGTLTHNRTTLEQQYGASVVLNNGIVPWAVGEVVVTLTQQFQALQWSAAATTIADLCHYVGDATQPLHCTQNYDGQFTGNNGIHSRYETSMMSLHIGDLNTAAAASVYYANSVDAMFSLVGASWSHVAPLLDADNEARAVSGGSFDPAYYSSLWGYTQSFTRQRIDFATLATASFVYTAWVNAGRPTVPGSSSGVPTPIAIAHLDASPIPFRDALRIDFSGGGSALQPMSVDVYDLRGAHVGRLVDRAPGAGTVQWRPTERIGSGIYFLRLTGPGLDLVKRVSRIE